MSANEDGESKGHPDSQRRQACTGGYARLLQMHGKQNHVAYYYFEAEGFVVPVTTRIDAVDVIIRPDTGAFQIGSFAPGVFQSGSVGPPPPTPPPVPLPWLPGALAWVFPARFYKEVLEQTISDMHVEYAEAKCRGQTAKAWWVVVCAVISIFKSVVMTVALPVISACRVIHAAWRMFFP